MKEKYIYITLATVIFSTMEIALKLVAGAFNPIQLTFTRFFIGGISLIPFAYGGLRRKGLTISRNDLKFFAFLGFLCTVVSMVLYQLAVVYTKASVVAVLFSCNPIFVTILAYFILKEAIHTNNIAALVLDLAGIIVIINPISTKLSVPGVILTLASTIIFALYGVFGKKKCAKYGGIVVTCFSFLFGSLELLMLIILSHFGPISTALYSGGLAVFSNIPLFTGYSVHTIPIISYICIINTGLGFACYFKSMEVTSAQTTSLAFFFKPILAPILALLVLHEVIPLNMLIGIMLILAGSLTSILPGLLGRTAGEEPPAD